MSDTSKTVPEGTESELEVSENLRESYLSSDQGSSQQESGWNPMKVAQNTGDETQPDTNPDNLTITIPRFSAGSGGPPHEWSAYQKKRTEPLVTAAGGPGAHVRASDNLKFPFD